MKITLEQAAQWFQNRAMDTPMPAAKEMFHMAAEALWEKAEREKPRPLTLEELRQLIDVPVYVSYPHNSNGEWIIFTYGDERGFETDGETWFEAKNYGKYWIAYRHKPREARE